MCDTVIAFGEATENGEMIFGKNSDRDPREAQNIVVVPSSDYEKGSMVRCTYIEIPQVEHTFGVMLSQPEWMWGAEMGINEKGVVIGNEAIFTKAYLRKKNDRLLGMDLLRLGLERGDSAKSALEVIIELLEKYGQGGNCKSIGSLYYHNSFLIGDGKEAFVLETADNMWIWKKIKDKYSISNIITIESEYDGISDTMIPYAVKRGWCKGASDFNFKKCFGGTLMGKLAKGQDRRDFSYNSLCNSVGKLNFKGMTDILRSHGTYQNSPDWKWSDASLGWICSHSKGITTPSESTNSMITVFKAGKHYSFSSFGPFPCCQIYRFVYSSDVKVLVQNVYKPSLSKPDADNYWWNSATRAYHLSVRFNSFMARYGEARDRLEMQFIDLNKIGVNSVQEQKEQADKLLDEAVNDLKQLAPEGISKGIQKYRKKQNPLI